MQVALNRTPSTDQGTIGRIVIDELGLSWPTIELPWRDNKPNISCIPGGEYECRLVYSPRFKRNLYTVLGVPGRSCIRIHAANHAGDVSKGYISHLHGCIAPGMRVGTLGGQLAVLSSRTALRLFMDALKGEPFTLTVEDAYV